MRAFFSVVEQIGTLFDQKSHKIIVEKSTVPLGTALQMKERLVRHLGEGQDFDQYYTLVNMPEFLAEGSAIQDLVNPQRVVIGTKNDSAYELLYRLTQGQSESPSHDIIPVIRTNDTASSELGKLMCNAMLAQRISAINSMTALCE